MKITVHVDGARMSVWRLASGCAAVVVLCGSAIAYAVPLQTWRDGDELTAASLNRNFTELQQAVERLQSQAVPPGTVVAFAGPIASIPDGWLLCDGAEVSRTSFAALFTAIGTSSGSGDGATTFQLPDYRGRFLRGVDDPDGPAGESAAARDVEAALRQAANVGGNLGALVGSVQADQLRAHGHSVNESPHSHGIGSSIGQNLPAGPVNYVLQGTTPNGTTAATTTGITVNTTGGSETRPANVYVNFIIRS